MPIIPPGLAPTLQFYLSAPMPCPYLPDQTERKLFTRIRAEPCESNAELNAILCRAGFRRSQNIIYRPACAACEACVPVRIPVLDFIFTQSLRRIVSYNTDLHLTREAIEPTAELYDLFYRYQKARHSGSDMATMDQADFAAMLKEGAADTGLYCLREENGALKGCMIADRMDDGFSAVYSFFSPAEPRRSLGTALILLLINVAKEERKPFVYLGYWIDKARKMAYKKRFRPLQALGPNGWTWLE
ncbi:MAG: arginyltransferase [Alphaproteobacteria bacterium]|nr:arginyltransferase [Alphaproteobacteria bacterium]